MHGSMYDYPLPLIARLFSHIHQLEIGEKAVEFGEIDLHPHNFISLKADAQSTIWLADHHALRYAEAHLRLSNHFNIEDAPVRSLVVV